MLKLWPHQESGIGTVSELLDDGKDSICLTSPTGGGKTQMTVELIKRVRDRGGRVAVFTNRRMLTEQLIGVMQKQGLPFGCRGAGYEDYRDELADVQLCSIQTEYARMDQIGLPDADVVFVDEPHLHKSDRALDLVSRFPQRVGTTATPLDLYDHYTHLVQAGTTSELRKCGALLPCEVYEPWTFDLNKIVRKVKVGQDWSYNLIRRVYHQRIYGKVIDHIFRLNPDLKPILLCAPGVREAVQFYHEMNARGIRTAHIDGEDILVDGERYRSDRKVRKQLFRDYECGRIQAITFRFVLREGVDLPHAYHLVLATPIGSLASYIQVTGRILRSHHSLDHVILQDHGGSYVRHGSPNACRDWSEVYYIPSKQVTTQREDAIREGLIDEPITCPQCSFQRLWGMTCPKCGFEALKRSRRVIEWDGRLELREGNVYTPRTRREAPDTTKIWESQYFRFRNTRKTFLQAEGLFLRENGYYPPRNLPFMPQNHSDWFLPVKSVPRERLIQKEGLDERNK